MFIIHEQKRREEKRREVIDSYAAEEDKERIFTSPREDRGFL